MLVFVFFELSKRLQFVITIKEIKLKGFSSIPQMMIMPQVKVSYKQVDEINSESY